MEAGLLLLANYCKMEEEIKTGCVVRKKRRRAGGREGGAGVGIQGGWTRRGRGNKSR